MKQNSYNFENEVKNITGVCNTIFAFLNTLGGEIYYALNTPGKPYNANKYGETKDRVISELKSSLGNSEIRKYISFKEDDVLIKGVLYLIIIVKRSSSIHGYNGCFYMRVGGKNKIVEETKKGGSIDEERIKEIIAYNRWVQNGDFGIIKNYEPDEKTARDDFRKLLGADKKFLQIGSLGGGNYFYKYLNVKTFLTCLQNGNFRFAEPVEWKDKYEARFYNATYSKLKKDKKFYPFLYANCLTNRPDSEAAWQVYRYGKTGPKTCCVEIQIDRYKFREQLAKKLSDCDVYVGMTRYEHKAIIDCIHLKKYPHDITIKGEKYSEGEDNNEYKKYFDEFCLEKYLNLMLLKRMAYEYEHEIRFFILPHDKTADDKTTLDTLDLNRKKKLTEKLVNIDWLEVIESIRIDSDYEDNEREIVENKLFELIDKSSRSLDDKNELKKKLAVEVFNVHGSEADARITIGEDPKLSKKI